MSGGVLSVFLDVLVLIFLGVTIYYAIKLSNSLNSFRQMRQEFTTIMRTLSKDIDEAHRALDNLKQASKESGLGLQKILNESKKISGELQVINNIGNKAADRLESLIEQTRSLEQGLEEISYSEPAADFSIPAEEYFESTSRGDFSIRDKEYNEEELRAALLDDEEEQEDMETEADTTDLQSQAEKDLFEALQKTRKAYGRGQF